MRYDIGDILECKQKVNTQELEMCNPYFDIFPGDRYIVVDRDDFPEDNNCHWYKLAPMPDKDLFLNAWNDEGHMIIDDRFVRLPTPSTSCPA